MEKTKTLQTKELELLEMINNYISDLEYYIWKHYELLEDYRKENNERGVQQEEQIIQDYLNKIEINKQRINNRRAYYGYLLIMENYF